MQQGDTINELNLSLSFIDTFSPHFNQHVSQYVSPNTEQLDAMTFFSDNLNTTDQLNIERILDTNTTNELWTFNENYGLDTSVEETEQIENLFDFNEVDLVTLIPDYYLITDYNQLHPSPGQPATLEHIPPETETEEEDLDRSL